MCLLINAGGQPSTNGHAQSSSGSGEATPGIRPGFCGRKSPSTLLGVDAEARTLLLATSRQQVTLWDVAQARRVELPATTYPISTAAIVPDASRVLEAFYSHEVRVWNVGRLANVGTKGVETRVTDDMSVSAEGRRVTVSYENSGDIRLEC